MKLCLWYGDSPVANTGLGKITRYFVPRLMQHGFTVIPLVFNYYGVPFDKSIFPLELYPAAIPADNQAGGFSFEASGAGKFVAFLEKVEGLDTAIICNDPWVFSDAVCGHSYIERISRICKKKGIRLINFFMVDGPIRRDQLEICMAADINIVPCEYAIEEVQRVLAKFHAQIVPLGVDFSIFNSDVKPDPMLLAQCAQAGKKMLIGGVSTNAARKDLPSWIQIAAGVVEKVPEACFYMQTNLTSRYGDGFDPESLAKYLGLRVGTDIIFDNGSHQRLTEQTMASRYKAFDFLLNTSTGEGFWLPGYEALACGTVCCCSANTAMLDLLPQDIVHFLPVEEVGRVLPGSHGLPRKVIDIEGAIEIMEQLALDKPPGKVQKAGCEWVEQFSWNAAFDKFWSIIERK